MSETSEAGRIERDLDQTRSRLDSHLNELQGRLSPGQVLDDLMGYFRGSEGAAFGRNLMDNVRGNPMPAALTGIGLAWLMASGPRTGAQASASGGGSGSHYGQSDHGATLARVRQAEGTIARSPNETEQAYSYRLDEARGSALGLSRHADETEQSFGERIGGVLASAQQAVTEKAHDLRDAAAGAFSSVGTTLGSVGSSAQNAAQGAARYTGGAFTQGGQSAGQMGSNLVTALADSPVLLGALGLAAGALLGAILPQSDQEEAALGNVAAQARDTVTGLAQQGMERGKQVAQTVADKAREGAQHSGLADKTPGQLVDAALSGELTGTAKSVAQDVLRTSDEAVRNAVTPPAEAGGPQSHS